MNRAMRSVGAVSNSREGTAVAQPSVNIAVVSRAAARWFTGIFLKADKQPPSPFHDRHAAILSKLSSGPSHALFDKYQPEADVLFRPRFVTNATAPARNDPL